MVVPLRVHLSELPDTPIEEDHTYWSIYVAKLVGPWLNEDAPVKEICAFNDRVYGKRDLATFAGDPAFARNDAAQKCFSKLRSAISGIYVWRYAEATTREEKERLAKEADYSFRQALALCPYSPEGVCRYSNFLSGQQRAEDALLIVQTWQRIEPGNQYAGQLLEQFRKAQ